MPELKTRRLTLRATAEGEVEQLREIWNAPAVKRFLFDNRDVTSEWARELLRQIQGNLATGLGSWTIRSAETEEIIGTAALTPAADAARREPRLRGLNEPIIALHPSVWRRGFATEALGSVLAYGFDSLRLRRVGAAVDAPNADSLKLIRKLGFQPLSEVRDSPIALLTYLVMPRDFRKAVPALEA